MFRVLGTKTPADVLDASFDFSAVAVGETITLVQAVSVLVLSGTWADAAPADLTPVPPHAISGASVSVRLSGGAAGVAYAVTVRVEFPSGRVFEQAGVVHVVEAV